VSFVGALPGRRCPDLRINILAGDDAATIRGPIRDELAGGKHEIGEGLNANAGLRFTAMAHPAAWTSSEGFSDDSVRYFRDEGKGHFHDLFRTESLDDGRAIMGYDAMLTAARAVRMSVSQQELERPDVDIPPAAVTQVFKRLHGELAIPGASGWLSFNEDGTPNDKAMPLMRVEPTGELTFEGLVSASGLGPRRT
jgi:hypothetical protein